MVEAAAIAVCKRALQLGIMIDVSLVIPELAVPVLSPVALSHSTPFTTAPLLTSSS